MFCKEINIIHGNQINSSGEVSRKKKDPYLEGRSKYIFFFIYSYKLITIFSDHSFHFTRNLISQCRVNRVNDINIITSKISTTSIDDV